MITTGEVPILEEVVAAAMIAIEQEKSKLRALQYLKMVKNFRMYFFWCPQEIMDSGAHVYDSGRGVIGEH